MSDKTSKTVLSVLWDPYTSVTLDSTIVQFTGGYITEIHQGQ